MEKVFFKIIIPNYNNMPYIKKCLDSILEQTFQDFKIIIVDDLSTDMSDKFCEMYARKYPEKITFIRLKEKGHEGGARNAGIAYKNITSQYVYFIDGDDELYSTKSLQIMYDALYGTTYDILLVSMVQKLNNKIFPISKCTKRFDINSKYCALSRWSSASAKAVKSTFIVPFLEKCDHGADVYQFLKLLDKNPTIKEIDDIIYLYNRNLQSLTMTTCNTRYLDDTELFYEKLAQLALTCKTRSVRNSIIYRISLYNSKTITN